MNFLNMLFIHNIGTYNNKKYLCFDLFDRCSQGEKNQVMFFLNEHLVHYDGCDVGLCSWNYLKHKLSPIVDPATCNNNFCFKDSANLSSSSYNVIVLILSLLTVINMNRFT